MPKKLSRRQFIGQASCAAVGSTTLFSSLANMALINKLIGTSLSPIDDYKALVCILLAGGNDSYNMLVPRGTSEYADYAATRSNLAIPINDLLPIITNTDQGKLLGVHPSMPQVQSLFAAGKLAFVSNVGTLIEPIANETEFRSGLKKIPLGLYSHSDQIQQWQTAVPQSREAIGWGGKMADILQHANTNQGISMNISLSGRNVFQSGETVMEFSISNQGDGVEGIEPFPSWYSNSGYLNQLRDQAVKDMASQMYNNVFKATFGDLANQTIDSIDIFKEAIQSVPPLQNTTFIDHYLSQNLAMVARTIAARQALGMKRQTFFITFGGWDHHDEVLNNQLYMLNMVSQAIGSFMSALEEYETGLSDKVTLFTISDFARTLTTNGNGSDHAWGGNTIVAGGAVNGKDVYGTFPDLHLNGNDLMVSRRGNLIPTTSADAYFAELALWFGVSPNDLSLIFPNIGNFYNVQSGQMPLGFLNS